MRVLANQYHKGSPESLFQFLQEGEAEEMRKVEVQASDVNALLTPPEQQIARIHYSWLLPLIQKLPAKGQSSLIQALPDPLAKRLSSALKISLPTPPQPQFVQRYLIQLLLKQLPELSQVLPIEYLPATPMSTLLKLSKADLVELANFLGIHDLASELKTIVDTRTIKTIHECLTPQELQYLKHCMGLKEKFTAPSLGLERWTGDCDKLKATLHARGLIRLGSALSGEHPDLLWHLAHLLDTGRGQTLSKYYSKKPVPNLTPLLAQQVIYLMGVLKKKK